MNKYLIGFYILLILIIVILFSTGTLKGIEIKPPPVSSVKQSTFNSIADNVTRMNDDEAGVVCWVYTNIYAGGISCLPIKDTLLSK